MEAICLHLDRSYNLRFKISTHGRCVLLFRPTQPIAPSHLHCVLHFFSTSWDIIIKMLPWSALVVEYIHTESRILCLRCHKFVMRVAILSRAHGSEDHMKRQNTVWTRAKRPLDVMFGTYPLLIFSVGT